jgi:SAM-dependent methyltransferase
MDRLTLAAYDAAARAFADDWHAQPPPADLHALVRSYFKPGRTADVGCGSGRELAWLKSNGYPAAIGYDASESLLGEARRRYPGLDVRFAELPQLAGVETATFDNVLCETVIMHLPRNEIAPAVRNLRALLKPGGILYLSWRVTMGSEVRDGSGRLYTAFDAGIVRDALHDMDSLLDEEVVSESSGKVIHRVVARENDGARASRP